MDDDADEVATGAACPEVPAYDPLDAAQNSDPFPMLANARRETPIFHAPKYDVWVVTRREDALKIYRDPKSFSNVGRHEMLNPLPEALRHRVPGDYVFALFRRGVRDATTPGFGGAYPVAAAVSNVVRLLEELQDEPRGVHLP